ncbi:MAG: FHA domain-containing protein, partial [Actinomycetota bacterium]
ATDGTVGQGPPGLALRPVPQPDGIPAKRCPDGHPNDPEATTCRLCSHPLDVASSVVEVAPEPLARLLLEDGTAVDLVEDLVIGRCPPSDGHQAEVLTVAGRQVSRLHLLIEVRGWRLLIQDRGSTNGTFITRRGERGRRRVPEDRSIPLGVGETVHFGDRQALVVGPTG